MGVGIDTFSRELLKVYRDAVLDPVLGSALMKAIQEVIMKLGYDLGGKHYKRVPCGYAPDHSIVELLLYNGLSA